jgi:hypothetical protein
MVEFTTTLGPSVPVKALGSGSVGVDVQPGFEPVDQIGLHPGRRVMGTRSL